MLLANDFIEATWPPFPGQCQITHQGRSLKVLKHFLVMVPGVWRRRQPAPPRHPIQLLRLLPSGPDRVHNLSPPRRPATAARTDRGYAPGTRGTRTILTLRCRHQRTPSGFELTAYGPGSNGRLQRNPHSTNPFSVSRTPLCRRQRATQTVIQILPVARSHGVRYRQIVLKA